MLQVVERAPKLTLATPLSYSELYPKAPEPALDPKPPLRLPLYSQPPLVSGTGCPNIGYSDAFDHSG